MNNNQPLLSTINKKINHELKKNLLNVNRNLILFGVLIIIGGLSLLGVINWSELKKDGNESLILTIGVVGFIFNLGLYRYKSLLGSIKAINTLMKDGKDIPTIQEILLRNEKY